MKYDGFLARVRERGEYTDQDEAADVSNAVLEVPAQRISPGEVKDLASQLPGPLGQVLDRATPQQARSFGIEEFYRRVAERTHARPRTAQWDASAVLTTVADAVTGGTLERHVSVGE
ncbi:DUF2267 domain-containing protein [Streptomyces phaeochromogenes]|uniref:DUF2267 domain-containing protein n=1 Tax=Streptomyces phaeochromogenes TaxID=1923 RepID=UPI0036CF4C87